MPKITGQVSLKPFWQTTDGNTARLYLGDVIDVLKRMPAKSVQCVVTSPPYWGLRDYGTGTWTGGEDDCEHEGDRVDNRRTPSEANIGEDGNFARRLRRAAGDNSVQGIECGNCGATRIDQQIGSEKTLNEFVAKMVDVFREVRRVLRDDGTLWLNLGDSYNGECLGVPWRVALALQADGWYLRQDIIWHKPAPMPESVKNRCTKAHEYIFLLTKQPRYFYDAEAIKEKQVSSYSSEDFLPDSDKDVADEGGTSATRASRANRSPELIDSGRNKRSVWTISSQGYKGAHFATYPPKLITPCILAGTSAKGACVECGSPWRRVLEEKAYNTGSSVGGTKYVEMETGSQSGNEYLEKETKTVGWEPMCGCGADVRPCVVLDPFIGSGTSIQVALDNGRWGWGIDLSEKYLKANAIPRIEGALLGIPEKVHLAGRKAKAVTVGKTIALK